MQERISIKVEAVTDLILFKVSGGLDIYTVHKFRTAMDLLTAKGLKFFALDLGDLDEIDSEGIFAIRDYSNRVSIQDGLLIICGITNFDVLTQFRNQRIQGDMLFMDSVSHALEEFGRRKEEDVISNVDRVFRVGQEIEMSIEQENWRGVYYVKVLMLYPDSIVLSWPYSRDGNLVPVFIGMPLTAKVLGLNSCYVFETQVINRIITPKAIFVISKPPALHKDYKRGYMRVDARFMVTFQHFGSDLSSLDPKVNLGVCTNISGGGCNLVVPSEIRKETYLHLHMRFGKTALNGINGKVVRIAPAHGENEKKFELGIFFSAIFERDRNEILKYVLHKADSIGF